MARVIVLGAGVGGMSAAYELEASLGSSLAVTVVGDGGEFSFTPSNPWVGIGWRRPGDEYFMRKIRTGNVEPVYEKYVMKALGIERLKPSSGP